MVRDLVKAQLKSKRVLSDSLACFHLEFYVPGVEQFAFAPGQFLSCVAEDARGKQQTRAYSLASAPRGNCFDLCVNRVEGGFFSNRLCDMEPGEALDFHGPHGTFTLHQPLTESVLLATETGIAPMRGFLQSRGPVFEQDVWLLHGAAHEEELLYREEMEQLAAQQPRFHYVPVVGGEAPAWTGARGEVHDHVAALVPWRGPVEGGTDAGPFDMHVYICGLSGPVKAARERLKELGWLRKQIVSERYD